MKAGNVVTKEIDGTEYQLVIPGAVESYKLLGRSAGLVLPLIEALPFEDAKAMRESGDFSGENATKMLSQASRLADFDKLVDLSTELCQRCKHRPVDSQDGYENVIFDHAFAGKLPTAVKVSVWVVKEIMGKHCPGMSLSAIGGATASTSQT